MANKKLDVQTVAEVFLRLGQKHEAAQGELGISRATLFRYLADARKAGLLNGAAAVPAAAFVPAPSIAGVAPAAPAAVVPAQVPAAVLAASAAAQNGPQGPVQDVIPQVPVPASDAALRPAQVGAEGGALVGRDETGALNVGAGAAFNAAAFVPVLNAGELEDYRPRETLLDTVRTLWQARVPVLLWGEAGVGKTSIVKYLAAVEKRAFLEVSCDSALAFGELFGQVNITDGTSHFVEGIFLKLLAAPSIILIDEVTALDPSKSFKLHQLLNSREVFVKEADRGRGKVFRAHPDCSIFLAGNPPGARYGGAVKPNVALINRCVNVEVSELTTDELRGIVPTHAEKDNILRYYTEARAIIAKQTYRTTFSVRNAKRLVGLLGLGFSLAQALDLAFLNEVKLTAGKEAHEALGKVAAAIWDLDAGKGA